jgi:phage shock protein C
MQDAIENPTIALPFRDHTILGVCEAIGEDFGINPLWLRVPLAASVLVSLKYAIAAYLLLGVIILGSRLLFPNPKVATSVVAGGDAVVDAKHSDDEELPLAA